MKKNIDFFLSAYLTDDGPYVPSERVARTILKLETYSAESHALGMALRGATKPEVPIVHSTGRLFTGTTFLWAWWCGSLFMSCSRQSAPI